MHMVCLILIQFLFQLTTFPQNVYLGTLPPERTIAHEAHVVWRIHRVNLIQGKLFPLRSKV